MFTEMLVQDISNFHFLCCYYSWLWSSTFPPQWSCELSSYNRGVRRSLPL